jgi:multisubunit Na+/H+ antiporter MnhE subunit
MKIKSPQEWMDGFFWGIMSCVFILIFGAFSGMFFHVHTIINTIIFLIALILDVFSGGIMVIRIIYKPVKNPEWIKE